MARKTVPLDRILEEGNRFLASAYGDRQFRLGVICMLETALLAGQRYKGFGYLSAKEVPPGELPGIKNNGTSIVSFPDDTRRRYA